MKNKEKEKRRKFTLVYTQECIINFFKVRKLFIQVIRKEIKVSDDGTEIAKEI